MCMLQSRRGLSMTDNCSCVICIHLIHEDNQRSWSFAGVPARPSMCLTLRAACGCAKRLSSALASCVALPPASLQSCRFVRHQTETPRFERVGAFYCVPGTTLTREDLPFIDGAAARLGQQSQIAARSKKRDFGTDCILLNLLFYPRTFSFRDGSFNLHYAGNC